MQLANHPYFSRKTEAAPLAVFRILFGLMMFISIVRFWLNGWIEKLYLEPKFFFSYYGFEWVKPLGIWTYALFIIAAFSSVMISLGYRYRLAIVSFFLSFTYIELMDKTTYLNHYYFVSLMSFILIWLPANAYFSVDAYSNPKIAYQKIAQWNIDVVKLMLGIVYFYAGLAKINSDWMFEAKPLSIWLSTKQDFPILGAWMNQDWLHYAFSWTGMVYDLTVPFLLLSKRYRIPGFVMVVIFHLLTRALFPIGMFPYIMIASTLIFFGDKWHHIVLSKVAGLLKTSKSRFDNAKTLLSSGNLKKQTLVYLMASFFLIQLTLPFRYLAYPGELFWTEEGFRFSWRVMLMEKAGYTTFKIVDASDRAFYADNREFLTAFQEKQMSFQPDFILEFAHFLRDHYESQGYEGIRVYADSFVALNGRRSTRYIDPEVDLAAVGFSWGHRDWVLPFEDEIRGL